jgi:hypothetical protein
VRLWTLHPKYLDAAGLVALWREGLLARAVLRGRTRGYRHHPQLERFRAQEAPAAMLDAYLAVVLREAQARGYAFDASKIAPVRTRARMPATTGQMRFEWEHLMRKLRARSPARGRDARAVRRPEPHPLFRVRRGGIASWERGTESRP